VISKIKNQRDYVAGLFFVGLAIVGATLSGDYDMGSPSRMGPGYFPMLLSVGLGLLGAVIIVNSFLPTKEDGQIEKFHFKPLMIILGSIVLFGLLLKPLGLIVSIIALVVVSSIGSPEKYLKEIVLSSIFLAIFAWLVFIKGLALIIPVWPAFLNL
jgi:hypothetical protein